MPFHRLAFILGPSARWAARLTNTTSRLAEQEQGGGRGAA